MTIFSGTFLKALAERSISTFAEALVGVLLALGATDLLGVDWKFALSAAGLTTVMAMLKGIAAAGFGKDSSPGFGTAETLASAAPDSTD